MCQALIAFGAFFCVVNERRLVRFPFHCVLLKSLRVLKGVAVIFTAEQFRNTCRQAHVHSVGMVIVLESLGKAYFSYCGLLFGGFYRWLSIFFTAGLVFWMLGECIASSKENIMNNPVLSCFYFAWRERKKLKSSSQ